MSVLHPRRIARPRYSGDHWYGNGISWLYLDEILQIYDVMVAYAADSAAVKSNDPFIGMTPATSPPTAFERFAAGLDTDQATPQHVSVIINGSYAPESRAQIKEFEPKRIESIQMRVGLFELSFDANRISVSASRGSDDQLIVAAYDEIIGILSKRVNRWSGWITGARIRDALTVALIPLAALNLTRSDRWLAVLLFVDAAFLFYLMVVRTKTWGKRDRIILMYKENAPNPFRDAAKDLAVGIVRTALASGLAILVAVLLGWLRP